VEKNSLRADDIENSKSDGLSVHSLDLKAAKKDPNRDLAGNRRVPYKQNKNAEKVTK
jgi:hypothetical protein